MNRRITGFCFIMASVLLMWNPYFMIPAFLFLVYGMILLRPSR